LLPGSFPLALPVDHPGCIGDVSVSYRLLPVVSIVRFELAILLKLRLDDLEGLFGFCGCFLDNQDPDVRVFTDPAQRIGYAEDLGLAVIPRPEIALIL
jgi:hypothetical protein